MVKSISRIREEWPPALCEGAGLNERWQRLSTVNERHCQTYFRDSMSPTLTLVLQLQSKENKTQTATLPYTFSDLLFDRLKCSGNCMYHLLKVQTLHMLPTQYIYASLDTVCKRVVRRPSPVLLRTFSNVFTSSRFWGNAKLYEFYLLEYNAM